MTPYDTIVLYDSLVDFFPNKMKDLDINNVFPENDKRLSLLDSKHYEDLLKRRLVHLKNKYPDKIRELLERHSISESISDDNINLYTLFQEIKINNLTPCIVFQESPYNCKDIFIKLVGYLEKLETLNYPFYYENLEYRQDKYLDSVRELEKFKTTIKIGANEKNAKAVVEDRMDAQKALLTKRFIEDMKVRLTKQMGKITQNTNLTEKIKNVQKSHVQKEIIKCSRYKLRYVDIFKKHQEFSLSSHNPMSAEKIREIKKTISKKLGFDVSYTNVFMQGLKRGIGIYTKRMPSVYNLIVQSLAQNGELGFVIADDQLALGINMPFRSSCILGYNGKSDFKTHNYLQMIGRSGRRGKDREGHIIYANVEWKKLMKSCLEKIQSPYIHVPVYKTLSLFTDTYNDNIDKIFKYSLDGGDHVDLDIVEDFMEDMLLNGIIWKLRFYATRSIEFCKNIDMVETQFDISLNMNSVYKMIKVIGSYFLDDTINENIIMSIKSKNVELHQKNISDFLHIIKNIYSSTFQNKRKYYNLNKHLKYTFLNVKMILNNVNNLN